MTCSNTSNTVCAHFIDTRSTVLTDEDAERLRKGFSRIGVKGAEREHLHISPAQISTAIQHIVGNVECRRLSLVEFETAVSAFVREGNILSFISSGADISSMEGLLRCCQYSIVEGSSLLLDDEGLGLIRWRSIYVERVRNIGLC